MHLSGLVLSAAMALTATAVPLESRHAHLHAHRQVQTSASTISIHVINQCSYSKDFGVFQINSAFVPVQVGATQTIDAGATGVIQAPYQETGLRLSGNADWPIGNQIAEPQPLFEFGYAPGWGSVASGVAYDISMIGAELTEGISVTPLNNGAGSSGCESKMCTADNCPLSQAWTNEDQNGVGSPADTVCYFGPTSFTVTWCA